MRKKRFWKRLLAGMLAAAMTATSAPVLPSLAAPPVDALADYDYAKMYSLEEGRLGDYIAGNYKESDPETKRAMSYGEITYLRFSFPFNTFAKAEVYLPGGTVPFGFLYGISYMDHVENLGNVLSPEYQMKPGMTQSKIQNDLVKKARELPYTSERFFILFL